MVSGAAFETMTPRFDQKNIPRMLVAIEKMYSKGRNAILSKKSSERTAKVTRDKTVTCHTLGKIDTKKIGVRNMLATGHT